MREFTFLLVGFLFLSSWTSNKDKIVYNEANNNSKGENIFSESEVKERLNGMYTIVGPFVVDEDILDQVRRFTSTDRSSSKLLLKRREHYFPLIDKLFMEANLPSELKYLAAIESALNPSAKSGVGAAGLWQFMAPTARIWGLKVDDKMDQRQDVVLSTQAAIRYLNRLYNMFGDWALVLAAYNCGENKIIELIEAGNGKSFWELRTFLPRQTQLFVPAFIGMCYMMQFYGDHGLLPSVEEEIPLPLSYIKIYKEVNIKEMLKQTKIDRELFEEFNPSFKRNIIPESGTGLYVSLPDSLMTAFADYYISKHERKDGLSYEELKALDPEMKFHEIISFSRPYVFDPHGIVIRKEEELEYELFIPTSDKLSKSEVNSKNPEKDYIYHVVQSTECLMDIALQYKNTSVNDLIQWNKLDTELALTPGQVLLVSKSAQL